MVSTKTWAKVMALIAGVGQVIHPAMAAEQAAVRPSSTTDVVLQTNGEFVGRLISSEGAAVDGALVVVSQHGREIATTVTETNGKFAVRGLRGGVYQVASGPTTQTFRVWTTTSAPPSARPLATLVQRNVVRGQDEYDYFETDEMIVGGVAVAALIVGIIALDEANGISSPPPASP